MCVCPDSENQQGNILLGYYFFLSYHVKPMLKGEQLVYKKTNTKNTQDVLPTCAQLRKEKLKL